MGAWQAVSLLVELTPNNWTDITSYLAYPLVIRQGRPTEFDDPGPATMTFPLWNDDGRWMPDNSASPLFPYWGKGKRVLWKVTKGGVEYIRFVGWVTALAPDFPSQSTTGSVVMVTAVDALGRLAQRKLRSNLTEYVLARGRALAVNVDAYEADPSTASNVAAMTQYSSDPAAGAPTTVWGAFPNLRFSSDQDSSFGGVASSETPSSNKTICGLQSGQLWFAVHVLAPERELTAPEVAVTFHTSPNGASSLCHLQFISNGGGQNDLRLRNAANTSDIGNLGQLRPGQWHRVTAWVHSTVTQSNWNIHAQDGSFAGGITPASLDIRSIRAVEMPGATGSTARTSFGGVYAIGHTSAGIGASESFVGASQGSLSGRVADLAAAASQLPVSISTTGTLAGAVSTGVWSKRPASEVLQEMMRTHSGIAWARSRDSAIYAIGSDQLYPATPVATIDTDGDCIGAPRLVDGTEAQPTRIDVSWPGGTVTAVNTAAESGGQVRSRSVATVATSSFDAGVVAANIFQRSVSTALRISQVDVDLLGGATDHTAALFSEATTLGGLFPTQRVRLAVPGSHFGSTTIDAHVQGWTETYSPSQATVTLDTSPVPTGNLFTTISMTSGSTTLLSTISAFTPGDVGKPISGPGIPDGAYIESYISGTQVTISTPATQTGAGVWVIVSSKLIAVDWWGGANGAAWSSRWVAGTSGPGSSATCQGLQGRLNAGSASNDGIARRISGVTFTDGEIVCSVTIGQTGGFALIGWRADTGTASSNLYFVTVGTNGMFLQRSSGGTPTQMATFNPGLTPGIKYRVRVRAVGSTHRVRVWQASQPEPSGWHLTATNGLYASGAITLQANNGSGGTGRYFDFDDLAVTKEG